jgi:hypothetical protein
VARYENGAAAINVTRRYDANLVITRPVTDLRPAGISSFVKVDNWNPYAVNVFRTAVRPRIADGVKWLRQPINLGSRRSGCMVKKKNQVGVIYEIRVSSASGKSTKPDEYITCSKAEEQPHGWLHYELRDGTNGLAQPKNWRRVEANQQKR